MEQAREMLAPGETAPRNKELKRAEKVAQAAYRTCLEMVNELPERDSDEEFALQFEWLPTVLQ
eukprot:1001574-Prymnesium_polylepis.1